MRIMVLLLLCHLDRFPDNLGDINGKQDERFNQGVKGMEERYQGRWDVSMIFDYYWSFKRDFPHNKHTGNSMKRKFLSYLTIG